MKRPTDRATAIRRLLVPRTGPSSFHRFLLMILAAVLRLDAETRASREMQPRNRARQMVEVAGDCIGKEKEESQSGGHSGPDCEAPPARRRPVKGNERRSDSDGRPFASDRGRMGYLL